MVDAVNKCWNCGLPGHAVKNCRKPKNQEMINKNRAAFKIAKRNRHNGNGGSRNGNGGGTGKGGGSDSNK